MNKEKQIREMAELSISHCELDNMCGSCRFETCNECLAEHLINKGYRKASEIAEEIFAEIDAHFDKRIALYQTMKSRALLVGNEVEREYADTMIINLTIYKKEVAELKKKYTEENHNDSTQ